jgi:type IV pilus assembly protein PilV
MLRHVDLANGGFTLIEFLVALVILTVGLLGLLNSVNVSIKHNLSNKNRSEAIMLADQIVSTDRARPFADISSTRRTVSGRSGLGFINYSVVKIVASPTTTTKHLNLRVKWREKDNPKEHQITTLISN